MRIGAFLIGFLTFIGLGIVFSTAYTIDEGERGVILRNGSISGVAEPGFHLKTPFIESVAKISTRSGTRAYGDTLAYSRDQQTAALHVTVSYRLPVDRVEEIYAEYGSEEGVLTRLLDRQVNEKIRIVFGQFNAVTSIQDRGRLSAELSTAIINAVDGPIIIEWVQIGRAHV